MRLYSVLGRRLALLLAVVATIASGLTGYFANVASQRVLVSNAERELSTATQVLGRRFSVAIGNVAESTRQMAALGVIREALDTTSGDGAGREAARRVAGDFFQSMLRVRREFARVRLIGVADHGLERLRVERAGGVPVQVSDEVLQEKGHFPYVFKALELPPEGVFLSDIGLRDELGDGHAPTEPSLQVSAPVRVGERNVGVVVIDIDLGGLFTLMRTDLPPSYTVYLTNEWGDYLLHPDPSRSFAFERGQRFRAQDEFPALAPLYERLGAQVLTPVADGAHVAAFARIPVGVGEAGRFVVVGLLRPSTEVLRDADDLARDNLEFVMVFSALAALAALFLARAITRPVGQMVAATRRFSGEHACDPLPVERDDELGELARGFDDMRGQILTQLEELTDSRNRLETLVSQDMLTGLASRRMFSAQLDQALARARRNHSQLALMFVDLDRFKAVNDTYGHPVGDGLLIHTARLLRGAVREVDLVARLGGDEFVILFEDIRDRQALVMLADKLLRAFHQPVDIDGRHLEVSISIGVALFPGDGEDAETLMKSADQAMYRSKARGRDTFSFHAASAGSAEEGADSSSTSGNGSSSVATM